MAPMASTYHRRRDAFGAAGGRLQAALVVVALLLCHGALGGLHLAHLAHPCDPCDPPAEAAGAHHPAAAQQAASGDIGGEGTPDGSAHGTGASGYFAVLLVLFGATVLKLLVGLRTPTTVAALRPSLPRHAPVADVLPRGPTLPLLQVFRL